MELGAGAGHDVGDPRALGSTWGCRYDRRRSAVHPRAHEDSPDAAERVRSEFHETFQRLSQSPAMGHYHDELLDPRYRFRYRSVVCTDA